MWGPDGNLHEDAGVLMRSLDLEPVELTAKEGLAMINGTQLIASLGTCCLSLSQSHILRCPC